MSVVGGNKYLLDTCVFIWMVTSEERKLPKKIREIFLNEENELFVSIISRLEVSVKRNIGKLELKKETKYYFEEIRRSLAIETLSLEGSDIEIMEKLPNIHKDPFDRIIISQAINNGLTIISSDSVLKEYPVKCVW